LFARRTVLENAGYGQKGIEMAKKSRRKRFSTSPA